MAEVRVLYVEDDLLLRGLVVRCITERIAYLQPELALSWDLASTRDEAIVKLDLSPDAILVELELRGSGRHAGLRVLVDARGRALWVPVFVLGDWVDSEVACQAQKLHAHLVPKGGPLAVETFAELLVQCVCSPYDRLAPILAATREPLDDKMDATQAAIVRHTLGQCGGNKSAAARALGVMRQSSRLRMEEGPSVRPSVRPSAQEVSRPNRARADRLRDAQGSCAGSAPKRGPGLQIVARSVILRDFRVLGIGHSQERVLRARA